MATITSNDERMKLLHTLESLREKGADTTRINPDAPLDELRMQVQICQRRFDRENTERRYRGICEDIMLMLVYVNTGTVTGKQQRDIKTLAKAFDFTALLDPCYRRVNMN